ncbi:18199_t:CDS:2, partial [Rhizophagus irregularis]
EVVKTAKNLNFTHGMFGFIVAYEFTEDGESDLDELDDINHQEDETSNKENIDPLVLILRNPKKRYSKGRPLGTKRFKSSTEIPKPKIRNQRHCRKCGK